MTYLLSAIAGVVLALLIWHILQIERQAFMERQAAWLTKQYEPVCKKKKKKRAKDKK